MTWCMSRFFSRNFRLLSVMVMSSKENANYLHETSGNFFYLFICLFFTYGQHPEQLIFCENNWFHNNRTKLLVHRLVKGSSKGHGFKKKHVVLQLNWPWSILTLIIINHKMSHKILLGFLKTFVRFNSVFAHRTMQFFFYDPSMAKYVHSVFICLNLIYFFPGNKKYFL